jgi:hypothetical protein
MTKAKGPRRGSRQRAIARFCALALRGLDNLTLDGRQRLFRALVDEIIVCDGAFEIHGVLPGRWAPDATVENCPDSRDGVISFQPYGYVLVVPAGSRGGAA